MSKHQGQGYQSLDPMCDLGRHNQNVQTSQSGMNNNKVEENGKGGTKGGITADKKQETLI